MTDKIDLEKDVAIDPAILDEEWLKHPITFMKYAQLFAEAALEKDKIKDKLDFLKALVASEIRSNPDSYGLKKVTEAIVSEIVEQDERIIEIKAAFLKAKYEYDVLLNIIRSFEHRKKALENLVQLYQSEYFAGPREPRKLEPGKRMSDIVTKRKGDEQREKLNTRRRRKV